MDMTKLSWAKWGEGEGKEEGKEGDEQPSRQRHKKRQLMKMVGF